MTALFYSAAFLTFAIGVAHSVLGERYILIWLFRRNGLPKLFGGTSATIRTLRFTWHITTLAWWGYATILVLLAPRSLSPQFVVGVGRHLPAHRGHHFCHLARQTPARAGFSLHWRLCTYAATTL